jgi:hypothetical protein
MAADLEAELPLCKSHFLSAFWFLAVQQTLMVRQIFLRRDVIMPKERVYSNYSHVPPLMGHPT